MSNLTEDILIAIKQIARAIDLHSKKLMQKYGLTGPQIITLKEIKRLGESTVGVLSHNINLSQATVTSILDRLEKRNYVTRVRSTQDKRKVYVTLTPSGEAMISQNPSLLQEDFVNRIEGLEEWERAQILSTLQRVALMMNAKDLEVSPILSEVENGNDTTESTPH